MSGEFDVAIVGAGQSGLAGARAVLDAGLRPVLVEAGARPVGAWPSYYDSLTLFSPAGYSGFPDRPFGGDPASYPARDEVVEYLEKYAAGLPAELRTGARVTEVVSDGSRFLVRTEGGDELRARAVIAASGSFTNPYMPRLAGRDGYRGEVLHVADYRRPEPYLGKRVVVVGAGNSAVQVAYELAKVSTVTMATRAPVLFMPQVRGGRDIHFWFDKLKLDLLPPSVLARLFKGTPVLDTGVYRAALESGEFQRREMFVEFAAEGVVWPGGDREAVDVVLFATGYRPSLPYLAGLGALDPSGMPLHRRGLSTTHPRLGYLGVEFQRSFSSNTLRGVHRDAGFVVRSLREQLDARP